MFLFSPYSVVAESASHFRHVGRSTSLWICNNSVIKNINISGKYICTALQSFNSFDNFGRSSSLSIIFFYYFLQMISKQYTTSPFEQVRPETKQNKFNRYILQNDINISNFLLQGHRVSLPITTKNNKKPINKIKIKKQLFSYCFTWWSFVDLFYLFVC